MDMANNSAVCYSIVISCYLLMWVAVSHDPAGICTYLKGLRICMLEDLAVRVKCLGSPHLLSLRHVQPALLQGTGHFTMRICYSGILDKM